jgi:hypothetical protein
MPLPFSIECLCYAGAFADVERCSCIIVNHDKSGKYNIMRKGNYENQYWEGGEVYVVPNGPCGPPMLVLMEVWGVIED